MEHEISTETFYALKNMLITVQTMVSK
ncbi:MAG: hypothetical protein GX213_07375 [Clostridiaceae bacterium]|nr:hypothetical protein [Clostridiaceae bacterium]